MEMTGLRVITVLLAAIWFATLAAVALNAFKHGTLPDHRVSLRLLYIYQLNRLASLEILLFARTTFLNRKQSLCIDIQMYIGSCKIIIQKGEGIYMTMNNIHIAFYSLHTCMCVYKVNMTFNGQRYISVQELISFSCNK